MKGSIVTGTGKVVVLFLMLVGLASCSNVAEHEEEASVLAQQFAAQLRPALVDALQSGGPIHAVSVCADKAPEIAQQLSEESGWDVRRVSLKHRNPNAAPDSFEAEVLRQFDEKVAAGQTGLTHAELIAGEYRFMKAQLAGEVCLICHGKQVIPALQAEIRHHYPDDMATGFERGDVRGAISLTKPLVYKE